MFCRIRRDALRLEIEILDASCDSLHRITGLLTGLVGAPQAFPIALVRLKLWWI